MSSYKCWSPDLGIPEEEGKIVAESWFDGEDAANSYVDKHFYDWESPKGPFVIFTIECNAEGKYCGYLKKFEFEVEYEPTFYSSEVE